MLIDYHIHTNHSGDGKMPLCDMIDGAIKKGCMEICITSHYDALYPLWIEENFEIDLASYCKDILESKEKYRNRIVVKAGVELGLMANRRDVKEMTQKALDGVPFDFCIGSLHCLSKEYVLDESVYWKSHTKQSFAQWMLEHLLAIANEYDCFDVMGHLTYFSRYCPFTEKQLRYEDAPDLWDKLFHTLIARGKGIEINTSTYLKLGFFMPDADLVKRYRILGGEIVTIGSDAHVPSAVAQGNKAAQTMLKEAGFRHICTFTNHEPHFEQLA